ncbi:TrkH family potassium uptake protein [uncultured Methanobrevibacter sp.]|uniref:TrkH family potassium uptake protein n=1 Tax=uncultured Methanobrevibacter sp. TaxID=253161 RepID=UPI0026DFA70C|nr:TrkH family potassium uptake protein [uncultured Methanobrevibacter sp.]
MMRYIKRNDVTSILSYSGQMMMAIGVMFLIPVVVDLIYLEFNFAGYLFAGLISFSCGLIFDKGFRKYRKTMRLKHAMIVSAFVWLWASLVGGIALSIVTNLDYVSSVFENMSALTGTGMTIFIDVESLPYSVLFFRAFEQWVGGLGVIVLVIAVITRPGTTTTKLYKSEARDERLEPSIKTTLKKTFTIYGIYTICGIILYILAGMPFFDSICACFTTISTGGMSIKNANMGFYDNNLIYIITMILMILGATSFTVHYKIIKTRGRSLIKDLQFQVMLIIIAISFMLITLTTNILPMEILFTIVSSITTTGATIVPTQTFLNWPSLTLIIIITCMLIGGSSGSTVGSIKLIRIITFFKGLYKHIKEIMSPEGRVLVVKLSNQVIPEKAVSESGNYITLFMIFILIGWAIFCGFGYDPFQSLFEIVSLQGNNGLQTGIISFDAHWFLKIVSIFHMWIGRLEIFPVLVLVRAFFEVFRR